MFTFTFLATFYGPNGIENDSVAIDAPNLKVATEFAEREINGVNSFADCLIDLVLLFTTEIQD
jgi:hypothetical protein